MIAEQLTALIETIVKIIPLRMIHSYEQGIRWTFGRPGKILRAGLHPFIWGIQSIDKIDTTCTSHEIENHIRTGDGRSVRVTCSYEYRVADVLDFSTKLEDTEWTENCPTLRRIAKGLLATNLCNFKYPEIWEDKEEIEEELLAELDTWAKRRGLCIVNLYISECVPTVNIRLFQDKELQ